MSYCSNDGEGELNAATEVRRLFGEKSNSLFTKEREAELRKYYRIGGEEILELLDVISALRFENEQLKTYVSKLRKSFESFGEF